jgi:uncharacterized membrane protein YeaQ/YmgE (transglycosylase-associated protein family)
VRIGSLLGGARRRRGRILGAALPAATKVVHTDGAHGTIARCDRQCHLVAGLIADFVLHTGLGIVATIALGIVGALVGGFVSHQVLGLGDITGVNFTSIVIAALGAIAVIGVARLVMGNRSSKA